MLARDIPTDAGRPALITGARIAGVTDIEKTLKIGRL
jgi:hypothetical protein